MGESRAINSPKSYWINYKARYDMKQTTDLSLLYTLFQVTAVQLC